MPSCKCSGKGKKNSCCGATSKKKKNDLLNDVVIRKKVEQYDLSDSCMFANEAFLFSDETLTLHDEVNLQRYVINKFTQIFDLLPLPIIMHDKDFNIVSANKAYLNLVKKSCKDVIGKYYGLFFPKDKGKPKKCVCKLHSTTKFRNKIYRISSFPMEDPKKKCYQLSLHIFEDITKIKKLTLLANLDQLTELHNRHTLIKVLHDECLRSARYKHPLSMMFIDIDNFKLFNDKYGHTEGDKILSYLGTLLQTTLRSPDLAFRFGGEEFLVLLPETTANNALKIAERIRRAFAAEKFYPNDNDVVTQETLSIGVIQCPRRGMSSDNFDPMKLVDKVDQAMYKAKQLGKNRTHVEK